MELHPFERTQLLINSSDFNSKILFKMDRISMYLTFLNINL